MAGSGMPSHRSMMIKVSIFAVAMLLVSAGLVVVFGDFRFGPESTYHATFTNVSRLKAGQKLRIAGVPVGAVSGVKLNPDNTIDVAFGLDKRYTLYSSTRAVIRYENLVGDRYLEITSGPGELRKLPPGGTINAQHTKPALDLDALLGTDAAAQLDQFDALQLQAVVGICRQSLSLSDAGRKLFAVSRTAKRQPNDADRLKKYLARFGLAWEDVHA